MRLLIIISKNIQKGFFIPIIKFINKTIRHDKKIKKKIVIFNIFMECPNKFNIIIN